MSADGCLFFLVMKKIEITIGDFPFYDVFFFFVNIDIFL